MDEDLAESLQQRTLESLDFDFVIERLRGNCCTAPAAALTQDVSCLLAGSAEEARALYEEVLELTTLEDSDLVLEDPLNIDDQVDACSRGLVLETHELQTISAALEALLKLRNGLDGAIDSGKDIPRLLALAEGIELPDELLDAMLEAFDSDGELSVKKFPQLAELRQKIKELENECANRIREVLSSGRYMKYLADDGYMQQGSSYVLSVKAQFKNKVGRTANESRSGRIAYVEPHELVEHSAQLNELQRELKFTIRRIFGQMCVAVSRANEDLKKSLEAAGRIDLARARLFLGEDMQGEVPEVGDEGIIIAKQARNPCLILRGGTRVVGYKLELGKWSQGIILSGPNAGGKTVVLKTVGLLALLARCGIPVPAGDFPRVDFFKVVLAEVGDMQTIVDDLSTYSAHLVASRIMLSSTEDTGPSGLVLVDEAGTGTDPAQGAALARAMLEAFLERGVRVVATTHCLQLKNWALEDPRTEIAAMEYKQGRPTFRLVRNQVGESHAIETARRLELPMDLVNRAEALLGEDQRSLLALQRKAEKLEKSLQAQVERAEDREAAAEAAQKKTAAQASELEMKEQQLLDMEADLLARQERMRSQLDADHKAQVDAHERKLKDIISGLQKGSLGGNENRLQVMGDKIEDLRLERDEASEAAFAKKQQAKRIKGALGQDDPLGVGDWVVVLARTPWYGFKGRVLRLLGGSGGTPVRVMLTLEGNGNSLELEKTQLAKTTAPPPSARDAANGKKKKKGAPARDYTKLVNSW